MRLVLCQRGSSRNLKPFFRALSARNLPKKDIVTITENARLRLIETLEYQKQTALNEAISNKLGSMTTVSNASRPSIPQEQLLSPEERQTIEDNHKYLKLSIKTKGCNGQQYDLNVVDKILPTDIAINFEGENGGPGLTSQHKLLIDAKAELFVINSVMDYETSRLTSGFVFQNPQVEGVCGCGESFNFDLNLAKK